MEPMFSGLKKSPESNKIFIGYHNCEGLHLSKLEYLIEKVRNGKYDLLFISETWFLNETALRQSDVFVAYTPPEQGAQRNGKSRTGIALLANGTIRQHITTVTADNPFRMDVTIAGLLVRAVYIPQRLDKETALEITQGSKIPSILMGDFNFRYPEIYGVVPGNPASIERRECIDTWISTETRLKMIKLNTGITNVDHVYASDNRVENLAYTHAGYAGGQQADHGILRALVKLDLGDNQEIQEAKATRWHLKKLSNPAIQEKLQATVDMAHPSMNRSINAGRGHCRTLTRHQRQIWIDSKYNGIMSFVESTCTRIIGKYDPNTIRQQAPDRTESKLITFEGGNSHFMRAFKRARKSNSARNMLQSRDPTISAANDALQFYEQIYQTLPACPREPSWHMPTDSTWRKLIVPPESVKQFFRNYDKNKSCGQDGLHARLIMALGGEDGMFYTWIADLYNIISETGTVPSDWRVSITTPIPKDKQSRTIDAQRPISLTAMLRRGYEAIMHDVFRRYDDEIKIASTNFAQAGFQPAQSTILHALASHEFQLRNNGTQLFIDFKQAYDRVNIEALMWKLGARGVPDSIREILYSLFVGCSSHLAINGDLTRAFERFTGIFQGSILAPMLWNLYIDGTYILMI